jgi:transcriptional regulator with XRE-family HTH domain
VSAYRLDVPALAAALDQQRMSRCLTWRGLAKELGISASTLSRLGDGRAPSADALVTLLVWLDLDTDLVYLIKPGGVE